MVSRLRARAPRRLALVAAQVAVVLGVVGGTAAVGVHVAAERFRDQVGERVSHVADSLAALPEVADGIASGADLQPIADLVAAAADVDYVVITDADGVRLTHPDEERVGGRVSTDPSAVLGGERFLGTEQGTLGPSYRAKVPVRAGGVVVGTASVGVLESDLTENRAGLLWQLLPSVLVAAALGAMAAAALGAVAHRRTRALEAEAAALRGQAELASALRAQTHEFANRLHVIAGLVEQGDGDEARRYIAQVAALPDPGVAEVDARIDANDARLTALLRVLAAGAASAGTVVSVTASGTPACPVDEGALTAAANLVSNAIEAAPGGTVSIAVRFDEDRLALRVADDGGGMGPEIVGRVFERGFTTKAVGAADQARGVGLATVLDLAVRRGGSVDVDSEPGAGTTFRLDLPLEREGAAR